MQIDPFLGATAPELGWVPSVRYLMRRARVLDIVEQLPRTTLLEVGCGAGALLVELSSAGFTCVGLETSFDAAEIARHLSMLSDPRHRIVSTPEPDWSGGFGLVCAFDVLEHIEDETAALGQWRDWLRDAGHLLMSVPAHSSRWGPSDIWAGHHRRYDRYPLEQLLRQCGFEIVHFECYGFPAANLTERLGRRGYARMLAHRDDRVGLSAASAASGIERQSYLRIFPYMRTKPGKVLLGWLARMQVLARRTDLGNGYLVLARRA